MQELQSTKVHKMRIIKKCIFLLASFLGCFSLESTIHVIGDSHAREFTSSAIDDCVIHYLGPKTMHRIGRDGLEVLDFRKFGIIENDTVVLVFGEIDVRCHIGKQRDRHSRDLYEILETMLTGYFRTIFSNQAFYKNIQVVTYTVTPPITVATNPEYESYGPVEDRVFISKLLNQRLSEISSDFGISVLDVYDDYADDNGVLITKLSDGNVHINERFNQPILKKLRAIVNLFKVN